MNTVRSLHSIRDNSAIILVSSIVLAMFAAMLAVSLSAAGKL